MQNKRELKIEITKIENNNVIYFKIIKQTHRGENFCKNGDCFIAKNGIILSSGGHPSKSIYNNKLFVRGFQKYLDNEEIIVSNTEFKLIYDAISEYNKIE